MSGRCSCAIFGRRFKCKVLLPSLNLLAFMCCLDYHYCNQKRLFYKIATSCQLCIQRKIKFLTAGGKWRKQKRKVGIVIQYYLTHPPTNWWRLTLINAFLDFSTNNFNWATNSLKSVIKTLQSLVESKTNLLEISIYNKEILYLKMHCLCK